MIDDDDYITSAILAFATFHVSRRSRFQRIGWQQRCPLPVSVLDYCVSFSKFSTSKASTVNADTSRSQSWQQTHSQAVNDGAVASVFGWRILIR